MKRSSSRIAPFVAVLLAPFAFSAAVLGAEPEFAIVIKDHKFEPAEVAVPANQKVKLVVDNQDATPEEFESKALKREKVIAGKSKATIVVGPLAPGRYPFVGEYHEKTAQGAVVAK